MSIFLMVSLKQLPEQQELNSKLLVPKVLNTVLFALVHDE
jgi:hypothetical protein